MDEEIFLLCYGMEGGFTPDYVESLDRRRREWMIKRLVNQKKREDAAIQGKKRNQLDSGTITEVPDEEDGSP